MLRRSPRLPVIAASPTRLPPLMARRTATLPISRLLAQTPQTSQSATPAVPRTTPQANLFLNPQSVAQGNQTPPTGENLTPQGIPAAPAQPIQPIQPVPVQLTPLPSEGLPSSDGSLTQSPTLQNGEPLPSLSPPERMALTPTAPTQQQQATQPTGAASPTELRSTPVTPVPTEPNSLRPEALPPLNQGPQIPPTGSKEESHTSHMGTAQPGTMAAQVNSNVAATTNPSYVLGAGDRLYIAVAGAPQLSGEQQVQEDGTLALPGSRSLRVSGLTLARATTEVAERYSVQMRVPRVAIAVVQPRPLRVSISGEVNRPGFYRLPVSQNQQIPNLMQALQMAQGVTQTADLQKVRVQRLQRSGTPQVITLNLREIMQSDQKPDLSLQDGDIILVPNAVTETASQSN
jgi:protein involved in polysaccharide export with SLBB domain